MRFRLNNRKNLFLLDDKINERMKPTCSDMGLSAISRKDNNWSISIRVSLVSLQRDNVTDIGITSYWL
jgi:hypothetical protein